MRAGVDSWCCALCDVLVPAGENAGRPVRLDCHDGALESAAGALGIARGDALDDLRACLRSAGLIDPDDGVSALAAATDGSPPRYLVGLAGLVLAASRMASDEAGSMAAYYRRLGEVLDLPLHDGWPGIPGVPELVRRFGDLAEWMEGPEGGQRGILDLPEAPHPKVVGVPISQSLLRAGDRITLGAFFERTGRLIDTGWDPVHQLARWSGRHQLSVPLQTLLDKREMHAPLAGVLRQALRAWDGATVDEAGRRLLPGQLALHLPPGPLVLSVTVPALNAAVTAAGPGGKEIVLDPQTPAAVPWEWLDSARTGPVIAACDDDRIRILDGPTILFEITPLGLEAVKAAAQDPVWVLTCDEQLTGRCESSRKVVAGLPASWVILCDVEPDLLGAELRTSREEDERPLTGVAAVGGLPLAKEVWLLDHPPRIAADLPEPAGVDLDGKAHGDLEPGEELDLAPIAHIEGAHTVAVGEVELTVELAVRGARNGTGTLAIDLNRRRAHAGARPDQVDGSERLAGAVIDPAPQLPPPTAVIVRYRATVDVIDIDGKVRQLGPPVPAAWLDHVKLPQEGPWEIPYGDQAVWVCVDSPGRKFVVAYQALDVRLTDEVLDTADWYADAQRIVDRSGGGATERWQRLADACEAVA